jgi:SAM-dependent methyltransferase
MFDPGRAAALRSDLTGAGYTLTALRDTLGLEGELSSQPADIVIAERRLAELGPAHALAAAIALFALGLPVAEASARAALPASGLTGLEEAGILSLDGGRARARLRIVPHGDLLIASDLPHPGDGANARDHVTGVNAPARLLASLAVRRRVATALDLGCGNGVQALLAARHSERVVATDVNPRALAVTAFNAALNGVGNIECRQGSLFEPVAGERFGLILSNPPYVISPDSALTYRDSGLRPGLLCRRLVGDVPDHLVEGGFAQLLASWPSPAAGDWAAPLRGWLPAGVDAWLLHYRTEDPLTHAAKWNRSLPVASGDFARAVDRWLAYDREQRVDAISFGAVNLHRRSPGGRVRADEMRDVNGAAGAQVERAFAAMDHLDGAPERGLSRLRLRLVPEHRLEQSLTCSGGEWRLDSSTLSLATGLGFQGALDPVLARLLPHLDGRPLESAVAVTARELDVGPDECELLGREAAAMARRLLELGFLEILE